RERLVRQEAADGWDLPVHEVLKVKGPLAHNSEITWVHSHPEERERDPKRNYKILSRDLREARTAGHEPSIRTLAYLGTECLALGRPDEAIPLLREYLDRPDARFSEERCQVAHKLSIALRMPREGEAEDSEDYRARLVESEAAGLRAIAERPDWADGYIDLAEIELRRERWEEGLRYCETALRLEAPKTMLIINPLDYTYQPQVMRSIALFRLM